MELQAVFILLRTVYKNISRRPMRLLFTRSSAFSISDKIANIRDGKDYRIIIRNVWSEASSSAYFENTTFRFEMTHPNKVRSMTGIKRDVNEMLRSIEQGQPVTDTVTLMHATYLCGFVGRIDRFIDVSAEWFRQTRPLFDKMEYFKASSILCNLGKANRLSNGRLMRNLGWRPVIYFIERMIGMGFQHFDAQDVVSALSGINDCLKHFSNGDWERNVDSSHLPTIEAWLNAFQNYLFTKKATDEDWSVIVREVAPMSMLFVKRIASAAKLPSNKDLMKKLAKLSFRGFDDISTCIARREPEADFWKIIYNCTPMVFAKVVALDVDAESISPELWESWFTVYLFSLERHNGLTITDFDCANVLACRVSNFRFAGYWPRFDAWYGLLENYISRTIANGVVDDPDKTRRKAITMIYNIGGVAELCTHDDALLSKRPHFASLCRLLEDLIASANGMDEIPTSLLCRLLHGYRKLRYVLDPRSFAPSEPVYRRIREWCCAMRKCPTSTLSTEMAVIIHIVASMAPPTYVLHELTVSFYHGLDQLVIEDDALTTLTIFGLGCLHLDYDPGTVVENFWNAYFEKVEMVLQDVTKRRSGARRTFRNREMQLLKLLPFLATTFNREKEFKRIRGIYETRVSKYSPNLWPKNRPMTIGDLDSVYDACYD